MDYGITYATSALWCTGSRAPGSRLCAGPTWRTMQDRSRAERWKTDNKCDPDPRVRRGISSGVASATGSPAFKQTCEVVTGQGQC